MSSNNNIFFGAVMPLIGMGLAILGVKLVQESNSGFPFLGEVICLIVAAGIFLAFLKDQKII